MSVSYGLNANNLGFDTGIDYATVTLTQSAPDTVAFDVTLNDDFFNEGPNFGIQKLYFNSAMDITGKGAMVNGPSGWSFNTDFGTGPGAGFNSSEFGRFNIQYAGNGSTRQDPLSFSIKIPGTIDLLMSYALDNMKGFAFSAHIAGFNNDGEESGWFATSVSPIPLPASVWLFGTALLGFIGYSRRTQV